MTTITRMDRPVAERKAASALSLDLSLDLASRVVMLRDGGLEDPVGVVDA